MIGHRDRETLIGRAHRRSFWDCPRLKNAVDLEAEIKVQITSMVLVNDKSLANNLHGQKSSWSSG